MTRGWILGSVCVISMCTHTIGYWDAGCPLQAVFLDKSYIDYQIMLFSATCDLHLHGGCAQLFKDLGKLLHTNVQEESDMGI